MDDSRKEVITLISDQLAKDHQVDDIKVDDDSSEQFDFSSSDFDYEDDNEDDDDINNHEINTNGQVINISNALKSNNLIVQSPVTQKNNQVLSSTPIIPEKQEPGLRFEFNSEITTELSSDNTTLSIKDLSGDTSTTSKNEFTTHLINSVQALSDASTNEPVSEETKTVADEDYTDEDEAIVHFLGKANHIVG